MPNTDPGTQNSRDSSLPWDLATETTCVPDETSKASASVRVEDELSHAIFMVSFSSYSSPTEFPTFPAAHSCAHYHRMIGLEMQLAVSSQLNTKEENSIWISAGTLDKRISQYESEYVLSLDRLYSFHRWTPSSYFYLKSFLSSAPCF